LDLIEEMLKSMKCRDFSMPVFMEHFLAPIAMLDEWCAWPDGCAEKHSRSFFGGAPKAPKSAPGYMQEHMEYFELKGFDWPPARKPLDTSMSRVEPHCSDRCFQIAWFVGHAFPAPKDPQVIDAAEYGFVDLNPSLRFVCAKDKNDVLRNPWGSRPGCLVSSTQLLMRYRKIGPPRDPMSWSFEDWNYRIVCGVELLAMAGWCYTEWPPAGPPNHQLATSLAGNCFSAFAFCPLIIAVFASLGFEAMAPEVLEVSDGGDVSSDCESSCDE
jgi:hypothetical protein